MAAERIQALEAEMVIRYTELAAARSKAEEDAGSISHLEGFVTDLEGNVSVADMERKAQGHF